MTDEMLLAKAVEMLGRAYVPYSNYPVGAALLAQDGTVYTGCNVENAAYGNTLCAERTALCKAVSEGARSFTTIAIAAKGSAPFPCGACRQSLYEFAPGLRVLVTWDGHVREAMLSDLLPEGFGPSSLGK
ncbi:MAG: cytidine deaminase [Clostridia bacterium]|nr:cytidine deaminase [Clostridia bacterium]